MSMSDSRLYAHQHISLKHFNQEFEFIREAMGSMAAVMNSEPQCHIGHFHPQMLLLRDRFIELQEQVECQLSQNAEILKHYQVHNAQDEKGSKMVALSGR